MRFLADESCDFAAVRALRGAGHDVATVAELAPGATDEIVTKLAREDRRILLTEDRDFGRLFHAEGAEAVAVIYIRFPVPARDELGDAMVTLVDQMGDRLFGKFVVLQPGRARVSESP